MKAPIEMLLDGAQWRPIPPSEQATPQPGIPVATHAGVMEIVGHKLRCYRLSDGRAVIDAGDFHAFLGLTPEQVAEIAEADAELRGARPK